MRCSFQTKAIYLITGGKQVEKPKHATAFDAKKAQVQSRIENIDSVRAALDFHVCIMSLTLLLGLACGSWWRRGTLAGTAPTAVI